MGITDIAEAHYDATLRIVHSIAQSERMLEGDLTGPAFLGLMAGAEVLANQKEQGKNRKAYLNSCVRNAILDFIKTEKHYGFADVPEGMFVPAPISLSGDPDAEDVTPEERLAAPEDLTQFKNETFEIIMRLPADYRMVFLMKLDDPTLSNLEIAQVLGIQEHDVQNRVSRGRKYFDCL